MNDWERLIDFLERTNARIDIRDLWMTKDDGTKEWVIWQRKRNAKKTIEVLRTRDFYEAIMVLEYHEKDQNKC